MQELEIILTVSII